MVPSHVRFSPGFLQEQEFSGFAEQIAPAWF
jgi:hypothetical protein